MFRKLVWAAVPALLVLLAPAPAPAQTSAKPSPGPAPTAPPPLPTLKEYRTIDGTGNTTNDWGSAGKDLLRIVPPDYADGADDPSGGDRPGARDISNIVVTQPQPIFSSRSGPTNMVWLWGQFMDHTIDLTDTQLVSIPGVPDPVCVDPFPIPVPLCDPFFDPLCTGTQLIDLCRSVFDPATGTGPGNPRQQTNSITAFIDASNVYGSDTTRATTLRRNDGSGALKSDHGPGGLALLPKNIYGLPNAGGADNTDLFLAGDVRANENLALTAMHTLWLREHNYWASYIRLHSPADLSDEKIYQLARAIVFGEEEAITFNEFLPVLLGPAPVSGYTGYHSNVDPEIENIFSTAAYRFGHSMLTPNLFRLGPDLQPIPEGNISLADAFFNPDEITDHGGIEPLLRGAARQRANEVDPFIVDEVRNFLFGPPGAGGFDLASLNIQRGRDHGHPDYNSVRIAFGLAPKGSFNDISSNLTIRQRLASAYTNVNLIDPWVGGLAEDHVNSGLVGELWLKILQTQFQDLRDGDRFWYQNYFPDAWVNYLNHVRLIDVIRRNTPIGSELQDNVFLLP